MLCPLCGKPARAGLFSVECGGEACPNRHPDLDPPPAPKKCSMTFCFDQTSGPGPFCPKHQAEYDAYWAAYQ